MNSVVIRLVTLCGFLLFFILGYIYVNGLLDLAPNFISITYIWIVFVFLLLLRIKQIPPKELRLLFCISILAFLNVSINLTLYNGYADFNYYKKVIMFVGSLIWIIYCSNVSLGEKDLKYIIVTMLGVSVTAVLNFQNGLGWEDNGVFLKFGFPNTNQTGMYLSICLLYLLIFINSTSLKLIIRCLLVSVAIPMVALVYLTGCRSAIVAVLFFCALSFIDYLYQRKQHIFILRKWLIFVWSIFPLLFLVIYMTYINSVQYSFNFGFEDAGKGNETRLWVWQDNVRMLSGHELFGNYYTASEGKGDFQSLNTHLDVILSYGVIPLILFIWLLYVIVAKFKYCNSSRLNRCGLYAFMSCFIIGVFEAGLVAGSSGLFIAAFGFLLLTNIK